MAMKMFCLSNPELIFNSDMPPDALARLEALSRRLRVGKVGFALDISDEEEPSQRQLTVNGVKKFGLWLGVAILERPRHVRSHF
jgi:hypothetical protein